jgi:hypothetical protein
MLLNLESLLIDGAFLVLRRGATRQFRNGLEQVGRPGSENMCRREWGFPRNLGDPVISVAKSRLETPGDQLQAWRRCISCCRERTRDATTVPPSEGNEVRRKGWQEVAVP